MKLLMGMIAAVTVSLSSQAFAAKVDMDAGKALAQKSGCMACHTIDKKLVGPALKDIAAKYKGKKADDMLVAKAIKGGTGVWGTIPMPPNTAVKPDDIKTIVAWILAQ